MTMTPPDPFGYGRIKLGADGQIERIIEQKDCTPEQAATLLECNAGCYAFDGAQLAAHIDEIGNDNAQSEYYLPDMLEILKGHGQAVSIFHCDDYRDGLGVNSRIQLAQLTAIARDRINEHWMAEGVTFIDPTQAWIGPDAVIGRDTVVWPQTHLIGHVTVGEECQLGPNSRLTDTTVGSGCTIDETIAIEAVIENGVDCGPRAYLRPGTHMLDGSKAGTHVEIKKSTIGEDPGAAPVLHRRHHHGLRRQRGRRLHHLQLRRRAQAQDRHRQGRLHRFRHHDGRARPDRRRRARGRRLRHHRAGPGRRTWPGSCPSGKH